MIANETTLHKRPNETIIGHRTEHDSYIFNSYAFFCMKYLPQHVQLLIVLTIFYIIYMYENI